MTDTEHTELLELAKGIQDQMRAAQEMEEAFQRQYQATAPHLHASRALTRGDRDHWHGIYTGLRRVLAMIEGKTGAEFPELDSLRDAARKITEPTSD